MSTLLLPLVYVLVSVPGDDAVDAKSIRFSADGAIEEFWIDGHRQADGVHADDWSRVDAMGSRENLRCIALRARAGEGLGRAGVIGMVELADGRWVPTDATWRVFAGEPPVDTAGRPWTDPDYDDRGWPFAEVLGSLGCGPWDRLMEKPAAGGDRWLLDQALHAMTTRSEEDGATGTSLPPEVPASVSELLERATGRLPSRRTAFWVWAGHGIDAEPRITLRKVFARPKLPAGENREKESPEARPTIPQALRADAVEPTGFSLCWQPSFAPQGIRGYEVAWNGLVMKTVPDTTARIEGITVNPRPQNYAWVRAVAEDGTRSAKSDFVLVATSDKEPPLPAAGLRVVHAFTNGFTLAWKPVADNVRVASYSLTVGGVVWAVPGAVTEVTIRNARYYQPGQTYAIKLTARDHAFNRSEAVSISAATAQQNPSAVSAGGKGPTSLSFETSPLGRFAIVVATDGRIDNLKASLTDAVQTGCEFVLVKGQIVPQLSANPAYWDAIAAVVSDCPVPVILSPLSVKDQWSRDRYDMMTARTGQPINQLYQGLGGRLWVLAQCENPRGNPDFLPLLEQWVHDAEREADCRWLFTAGLTPESFPSGVPEVILQLHRPTVDVMRMINGDRGHELAWERESNVACVCPQRNRSGGHYLVNVESERLVFIARQQVEGGRIEDRGQVELQYDREANLIEPATCRVPHPAGITVGMPDRVENGPAWTQNRFVDTKIGLPVRVQLLARSPRGAPLQFHIVQPPAHGRIVLAGDRVDYTPEPDFRGDDVFLYQADDGGPWPANTAWVRIRVGGSR
jgi:hypothetical protein